MEQRYQVQWNWLTIDFGIQWSIMPLYDAHNRTPFYYAKCIAIHILNTANHELYPDILECNLAMTLMCWYLYRR